jgi:tetratricopeptide (TPR) repeat protein
VEVGDLVDGRYRLLELLGEGAAGKVFRSEDRGRDNQLVAVKLLHAKDPRWENFFRREFDVLSKLHHPNLVRVYDFGPAPENNTFYFTQELVVGRPLLDIVFGKKVDEVAALFIEISRALEFIHGHGVLHRDLKPANILVQEHAVAGERVRVLDFGLWRELDPRPQKGARWAGTPPYLASEVLRGFGHSISADLYAVGVTLFQAVTRRLPHGRGTPQELLAARKTPAPDLTGVVAQPLVDLIAQLLDEEPQRRPASAAEVAARLSVLVPNLNLAMPITLGRARLVGRDDERRRVQQVVQSLKDPRADSARFVIVQGPDGVGKSRFVGEVKAEVQLEGGRSAIGRCDEDVCWSYRPIAELIRALAPTDAEFTDPEREVVRRLCPELIEGPAPTAAEVPAGERERFHHSAVDLFLQMARDRPLVLIVEDVGHIDNASVEILESLLRRSHEANIVIVVTNPTGDGAPRVPPGLNDAVRGHVLQVDLAPLPRDEVGKLISALLGVTSVPDSLTDTVMAHADGNPLLVEELVSLFIDRGEIERGEHGWRLDGFESSVVAPGDLQELIHDRLRRLSEVERRAFCALAVFNRPAGPKLLAAIGGVSVGEVRKALAGKNALGLIRVVGEEEGKPRVVFRHPRIRDALLADLRRGGVLEDWHFTCADVLEERAGEGADSMADTLAYHYEQAGRPEPALRWLRRAAEHALSSFAFNDAVDLGRRARKLIDKAGASPKVAVRCDLAVGRGLLFAGRLPEARAFLEGAIARADIEAAPEAFGELHVWLGRACNQLGALEQGARAVDRGRRVLDEEKHPLAYARLLLARGELHRRTDPTSALHDAERALRLMGERRSLSDELHAFEVLTVAAFYAGDRERAIRYARHRLKLSEKAGRTLERITALRHLSESLDVVGERIEARKYLNQALKLSRRSGYPVEESLLVKALGEQLYVSGAYGEAITRFQEAVKLAAQLGQSLDRADALRSLGSCYSAKGDYKRAIDHLRAALDQFEHHGQVGDAMVARCALANALIARGDIDDARGVLRTAEREAVAEKSRDAAAVLDCVLGNLALAAGDFDAARVHYLRSAAISRQTSDRYGLGEALVGYGQLLVRSGKPARALRMARRAETIFIDLDARGQLKRLTPLVNAAQGLSAARGGSPKAPGRRA